MRHAAKRGIKRPAPHVEAEDTTSIPTPTHGAFQKYEESSLDKFIKTIRNLVFRPFLAAAQILGTQFYRVEPVLTADGSRPSKKRVIDTGVKENWYRAPQHNYDDDLLDYAINDINGDITYDTPASPIIEPKHRAVQPRSPSKNILKAYRRRRAAQNFNGSPDIWMLDEVALPDPFKADNIFALDEVEKSPSTSKVSKDTEATSRKILTPISLKSTVHKLSTSPNSTQNVGKHLSPQHIKHIKSQLLGKESHYPPLVIKAAAQTNKNAKDKSAEAQPHAIPSTPAASTPARKSVSWGVCHAKPFYIESTIAEMQDSFLEELQQGHDFDSALSNVTQASTYDAEAPESIAAAATAAHNAHLKAIAFGTTLDVDDDDEDELLFTDADPSSDPIEEDHDEESGFDHYDSDSSEFDEDPDEDPFIAIAEMDEGIPSRELADTVVQQFKDKMQLEVSAAASLKPTIRPLISSLSEKEQALLQSKREACNNGRIPLFELTESRGTGRAPLTAHDFSRILPAEFNGSAIGWLNDAIINEYLTILVRDVWSVEEYSPDNAEESGPSVESVTSYWFSTQSSRVRRWFIKKKLVDENFMRARLILLPICHSSHWRLVAIKPLEKRIEYLDSLDYPSQPIIEKAREIIKVAAGSHYVADEWQVGEKQLSTRQENASDCGVFTCLNALVMIRGEDYKRVISVDGMMDARQRIAVSILSGHPTGETD